MRQIRSISRKGEWLEKSVPWQGILYSTERQKGLEDKEMNGGDERERCSLFHKE